MSMHISRQKETFTCEVIVTCIFVVYVSGLPGKEGKLTEVEKRKDLGGCGRLDLGLNDRGGGAVQGARLLRLNATITEIQMFVPEFFDSSCTKNKIHFFKINALQNYFFFYLSFIFEYHLGVWKASIFFYMNGVFFNDKAA